MQDIDNNIYTTVIIGNQEWLAENLKTTHYNDGTPIINFWGSGDDIYYGWQAVNSSKLAPEGWHIPTDQEWSQLITFITSGSTADTSALRLKEIGSTNWLTKLIRYTQTIPFDSHISGSTVDVSKNISIYSIPIQENMTWTITGGTIIDDTLQNSRTVEWDLLDEMILKVDYTSGSVVWSNFSQNNNGATNEYRFTILPSGYRSNVGIIREIGYKAMFWSQPEGFQNVWYRNISNQTTMVGRDWAKKCQQPELGMSVRLIKNT